MEQAAKLPPPEPKQTANWSAEVTSLPHLIAWVADHPGNEHLLIPNQPALNKLARNQKALLNIGGVTAVNRPRIKG